MTRHQIADALGLHTTTIDDAFQEALKEHPELEPNGRSRDIDYTKDQVFLVLSYLRKGMTTLQKTIIEEEFVMKPKPSTEAIGINGTEEFLERVKKYPKLHCCSTCAYCTKSTIKNNAPILYPYCKLWERYIHLIKADPYKDYCKQWEYSNKEPLIFYKKESPINKDIYGNVKNEVMGYDVSNFGVSDSKEVRLVTDVGLDL